MGMELCFRIVSELNIYNGLEPNYKKKKIKGETLAYFSLPIPGYVLGETPVTLLSELLCCNIAFSPSLGHSFIAHSCNVWLYII